MQWLFERVFLFKFTVTAGCCCTMAPKSKKITYLIENFNCPSAENPDTARTTRRGFTPDSTAMRRATTLLAATTKHTVVAIAPTRAQRTVTISFINGC